MLATDKIKSTGEKISIDHASDMSKKHENTGKPTKSFSSAEDGTQMEIKFSPNSSQQEKQEAFPLHQSLKATGRIEK